MGSGTLPARLVALIPGWSGGGVLWVGSSGWVVVCWWCILADVTRVKGGQDTVDELLTPAVDQEAAARPPADVLDQDVISFLPRLQPRAAVEAADTVGVACEVEPRSGQCFRRKDPHVRPVPESG